MKKETLSKIINNVFWTLLTLFPFLVLLCSLLVGGSIGNDIYSQPSMYTIFLRSGIGDGFFNTSSIFYKIIADFFGLFGVTNGYFIKLLVYVLYVQFLRILFNLVFFIFHKCHNYLDAFTRDDIDNTI